MENEPKSRNNTKIIIGVVLALFLLCSCVCGGFLLLGIGGLGGIAQQIKTAPKAYYEDCQQLNDSNECQQCCKLNGHNGHMSGAMLNDNGHLCGCL